MVRAGDFRIWKPKYLMYFELHEDTIHPWYGHRVYVREVEAKPTGIRCLVEIADAPKVNNPKAFQFWADEYELEREV